MRTPATPARPRRSTWLRVDEERPTGSSYGGSGRRKRSMVVGEKMMLVRKLVR